jgi:hypothetical protein
VANSTVGGGALHRFYKVLNLSLIVLQVLVLFCALAQPAYAYVDPGSGLFAFQVISSTFAGMIFLVRRRLRTAFRKVAQRIGSKSEDAAEK